MNKINSRSKIHHHTRMQGFTLIELLITLAITAFIGLVASQLISTGFNTQVSIKAAEREFESTARVWLKIENDFSQIVNRSIRLGNGSRESELLLMANNLTFTRAGWANPLKEERSELQRIEYRLDDGRLIRRFWRVLDRSEYSLPTDQVFSNVTLFEIELLTSDGKWTNSWPDNNVTLPFPLAIKVTMSIGNKPEFSRVFSIAYLDVSDTQGASNGN